MIEFSQHSTRGDPSRSLLRVDMHTFHHGQVHNQPVLADGSSRDSVAIALHRDTEFSFPSELNARNDIPLI
jgi:hypothetical protein